MVWGWAASPEPVAQETGAAPPPLLVVQSVGVDQLQVGSLRLLRANHRTTS